jgi:hypothetical protein
VEHFEAANTLIGVAPRIIGTAQLSIHVLVIPQTATFIPPWQQVVEELVSSSSLMEALHFTTQDAIGAIEEFLSRNANSAKQPQGDVLPGQNFRGSVHSPAALASVMHRSKSGGSSEFVCVVLIEI